MATPTINAMRVIDFVSASANTTKTYDFPCVYGLKIENDGASAIALAVNGITISIPANKTLEEAFVPTDTFTITATTAFRCYVRGA
ncbi:hypothetical protein SPSIL_015190 [Sporomusa silvacetica DSM 10669]|uniref:DUF4183 domain-containing protein n=1 Tax=Sporomusa silvacetica DSM 10669 TaxID=1123289 RepID=A0ABZ3IIC8_9FIRM|nr:hypothetical protein [Sporomusa silvacetica]OZC21581.1 hypothetical protein SPSIL_09920 [Sporomusa silvacetica DSM 10669]